MNRSDNVDFITSALREGFRYAIAIGIALLIGSLLIELRGDRPLEVYKILIDGAFGNIYNMLNTLRWATPLIIAGLANIVAFRSQIWNIGVEGQLLVGALASALAGYYIQGLPPVIHITLALLAGAISGMIWALIPAIAYVRFGINELVSTIMMNYIAILFTEFLVRYYLHEPYEGTNLPNWVATSEIQSTAKLPLLYPPEQANYGLLIAIAFTIILAIFYRRSVLGYEADMIGQNRRFALYGGVRTIKVMMIVFLISGALAGITGATEVMGSQYRFSSAFTKGLGFDGITVALLAHNSPLGSIPAGLFVAALRNGAFAVERMTNTNRSAITVIQALILLLFTMQIWLPSIRQWLNRVRKKRVNV